MPIEILSQFRVFPSSIVKSLKLRIKKKNHISGLILLPIYVPENLSFPWNPSLKMIIKKKLWLSLTEMSI